MSIHFNWDISYLVYFLAAAAITLVLTPAVKRFAIWAGCLDLPGEARKIHKQAMPLLGGLSPFLAFFVLLLAYLALDKSVDYFFIPLKFFIAILAGGSVLMIGGFFDDKYKLPPKILWLFPAAASLIVIASGIGVGIKSISNPFGNPISLNFAILGIPASFIFVFLWTMGMMFTTKFLDGLDGLVSGVGAIASITLFALSLTAKVNQPMTATMAIIFAGALAGYLKYSFYPAKIFMGDGGSLFVGFILGVLSIILGGKIATALLVMGIPILDVAWVIGRRLWQGSSPFKADKKHLHFRMLDVGLSHRQSVLLLYALTAIFGFTAVFFQSFGKGVSLIILGATMLVLASVLVVLYKKKAST